MNNRYLCAIVLSLLVVGGWGCHSSPAPMPPDGGAPLQIADFAKQLVEIQTAEDNESATTEDKSLVDNQDPSSFDPNGNTFPPDFFR
jgi:hypothetical protein